MPRQGARVRMGVGEPPAHLEYWHFVPSRAQCVRWSRHPCHPPGRISQRETAGDSCLGVHSRPDRPGAQGEETTLGRQSQKPVPGRQLSFETLRAVQAAREGAGFRGDETRWQVVSQGTPPHLREAPSEQDAIASLGSVDLSFRASLQAVPMCSHALLPPLWRARALHPLHPAHAQLVAWPAPAPPPPLPPSPSRALLPALRGLPPARRAGVAIPPPGGAPRTLVIGAN